MVGVRPCIRGVARLVVFCLLASCSSPTDDPAWPGPLLGSIPDSTWDRLYGDDAFPGSPPQVTPLDVEALLSSADTELRTLLEHAGSRGFGSSVEAATLSYPGGPTLTTVVGVGAGGRAGMVITDPDRPGLGFFTTIDEAGILEVSTPEALIRLQLSPEPAVVEQWDAHSSCKRSECFGGAIGFWFDSPVMGAIVIAMAYTCGECDLGADDTDLFDPVECTACIVPTLAFSVAFLPILLAAVEECAVDPCRWCVRDSCGSDEVTGRSCLPDSLELSPNDADWVVLETRDEYYCAVPDDYSYCRARGTTVWVEDCPHGCDGEACAGPPPTCDPSECELSETVGAPRCEYRPDDGSWVVVQDYDEQHCRPAQPNGETCVYESAIRLVERCEHACAPDGRSCGYPASLAVSFLWPPDGIVPGCAACRVKLEGIGGTFEGTTMIDGSLTLQGLPAGLYVVSGGCGPDELGPHRPSDLVLHPGVPIEWVLALQPQMDTTIELPNIVVPFEGPLDVVIRSCG